MARTLETLVDGLVFPEGPRWRDGRLWLSDMHRGAVLAVDPAGKSEEIVRVPGSPSGLGWLPDGRLLVVSMTDRRLLRLTDGALETHADLSELASFHCNDMVVAAGGDAYVGNFGFDLNARAPQRPAELIRVTPQGVATIVADALRFPNGCVITPDGRTLVVAETFGSRLTAFDVADDGGLASRRTWAQLEGAVPDGICLDAEGAIWVASPISNQVLRVQEGGFVSERIPTDQMAIACMLGGDDRRTLFVLTAPSTDPAECRERSAARVQTCRVEIPGAGLP
ncbi:MAG: SMP-30/gluconolactonase/LRE family protein [Myxococcota bacterium]